MLNTIEINFKLDKTIKRALTTELMIKSHDINVIEFHITFDDLQLTADHTVKVLSVFNDTKSQTNVNCDIVDGKAIYRPDTSIISQYEHVLNYVYVYHGDQSLDVREFTYSVDLSQIDKTALKVKTVYDQSYAELITEFEARLQDYKDSLPQASDLRAEVDGILDKFKVDSQNAIGYLGEVSTAAENAEASRVENESERVQAETERKEAELLREENYNQKVDTAIVEADVVAKVDSKVTELTPQITNLTAQLAQNAMIISDINISIRYFPRLDGEDNDSPRIQRCIDHIKNNSKSGTVLLTADNFELKETIVLPDHYTIKLKGMGNFENAQGTRLSWVGLNNDSVVEVNDYSQVEDLFIQTSNGATGIIGLDGLGSVGGRSPSRFKINNVHVKKCTIGFAFNYGWYNSLYDCFVTFCDVGYQFGYESNNFALYSCHANSCKKGVELIGSGSNQVAFYSCSFEVNSEVAIDLSVGTSRAWSFYGLYLESNTQSMLLGGQVTFDTIFINGDWLSMKNNTTPACIEILSSAGINIGTIYTTLSLPKDKLLFFNIENPTYSVNRSISLGTTYPTGFYSKSFAADLQNPNGALLKGLINLDNTNIKLIKSPLLDATIPYNNPIIKDAIDYEGYTVFGAYLMVTETLVLDNDYIVRFGNTVASEWSNFINVNLGSDNILPSQTILNVTIDFKLNPTNFTYRLNNTLATSGKYQVVFLATV